MSTILYHSEIIIWNEWKLKFDESNGEIQQPDIDSLTAIIQEKDRQIESLTAELEAVRKQYQGCQDALNRIKGIIEEKEGE